MIKPLTTLSTVALVLCPIISQAQPQSSANSVGPFSKKHLLSLGITRQSTSTSVSASTENLEPVTIDLGNFGIDKRDYSYFLDYRYRLKPKWSIFAGTFQFSGSGENIAEREFNYDGVEFTAGAQLRSELKVDVYILDLLYTVHRSENVEVMLGGGLHAFDLGVDFSGSVRIDDVSSEIRQAGDTLLAPVPNIRGAATWTLNENFGFSLVTGWLSANVDDYSGDFIYGHLRANYQINETFGASLGYQITNIDITEDRARGELLYDAELEGPSLTLTYSF